MIPYKDNVLSHGDETKNLLYLRTCSTGLDGRHGMQTTRSTGDVQGGGFTPSWQTQGGRDPI